jgi:hypothetical protein
MILLKVSISVEIAASKSAIWAFIAAGWKALRS